MSERGLFMTCACGLPIYHLYRMDDVFVFQHGENPEHVVIFSAEEYSGGRPTREIAEMLDEWSGRIHEFERVPA